MDKTCLQFLRILVIIFNFIFVIIGLCTVGVSIYLYLEPIAQDMSQATGQFDVIRVTLCVLIVVGAFTFVLGLFGCCGSYHESECLLGTYFTLLLVLFFVKVASGVTGYLFQPEALKTIHPTIVAGIKAYDKRPLVYNSTIAYMDTIQKQLNCCGAYSAKDYSIAIPISCCRLPSDECNPKSRLQVKDAYQHGCTRSYENYLKKQFTIVLIILIIVAAFEFLGLMFAVALCCSFRRFEAGYIGVEHLVT